MTTTYHHSAAFNDLAALLTGQLFSSQAADYEQVRQLWNGKVKTQPAAIARCLTVQDVIHTAGQDTWAPLGSSGRTRLLDERCLRAW